MLKYIMSFVLAVIVGLGILFFLKELILLGPIIAGFISGAICKSALVGLFAGLAMSLLGAIIFYRTPLGTIEIFKNTTITGFAFYENLQPLSLARTIFGITGVAAATIAGFFGGLLSK